MLDAESADSAESFQTGMNLHARCIYKAQLLTLYKDVPHPAGLNSPPPLHWLVESQD